MKTTKGTMRDKGDEQRETFGEYVARVTRDVPRQEIARLTGMDQSSIGRWIRGEQEPQIQKIVAFARGLGLPPLEGLVAAGYIEPGEANAVVMLRPGPASLSDDALVAEIIALANEVDVRLKRRPELPRYDGGVTGGLTVDDDE